MRSRILFGTSNPGSCPAGGEGEHAVAGHTFPAGTCAMVTYCSRWPAGGPAGGRAAVVVVVCLTLPAMGFWCRAFLLLLLCCYCSRSVDLLVFALSIPPLLSRNVSPQHPMLFSFSLGIRRAIDEALVRRFACLRAEIGSDGEGKEGVCNSSVRGLFGTDLLFLLLLLFWGERVGFFLWDVLCRTWRKTCVFFFSSVSWEGFRDSGEVFFLLSVCEEEDFLASGGEQRGFLLLQQGRKASQWRDCDDFTRRLLL